MKISNEDHIPFYFGEDNYTNNLLQINFVLNNFYQILEAKEQSTPNCLIGFKNKVIKTFWLFCVLLFILINYYFFLFWIWIPYIEASNSGMSLLFWEYLHDLQYLKSLFLFFVFHILISMHVLCLYRTLFTNPGMLHSEYLDVFSLINFVKTFYFFVMKLESETQNVTMRMDHSNIKECIEKIMSIHNQVDLILEDYLHKEKTIMDMDSFSIKPDYLDSEESKENIFEKFEEFYTSKIIKNKNYQHFQKLHFYQKQAQNKRCCSFCLHKKPDRTHHCRHCMMCVRKMDHHCYLLETCIGLENYKFFILFMFYGLLALVFVILTSLEPLFFYLTEIYELNVLSKFLLFFITDLGVCIALIIFFVYHLRLLFNNMTNIEQIEKMKKTYTKKNIFNVGWFNNFRQVMGSNCLLWFLPINTSFYMQGYEFEINQEVYNDIQTPYYENSNVNKV